MPASLTVRLLIRQPFHITEITGFHIEAAMLHTPLSLLPNSYKASRHINNSTGHAAGFRQPPLNSFS